MVQECRVDCEGTDKRNNELGITFACISALFVGISILLRKKTSLALEKKERVVNVAHHFGSHFKNWTWLLGMLSASIGGILNFLAFAHASAIIVSALDAGALFVTAILCRIFLKEKLEFREWVGIAICITSAVAVALSAPCEQTFRNIETMDEHLAKPQFIATITVYAVVAVALFIIMHYVAKRKRANAAKRGALALDEKKAFTKSAMAYLIICSLAGAINVVFIKIGALLFKEDIEEAFYIIALIIGVAACVATQIVTIDESLDNAQANLVAPIHYVCATGFTVIITFMLSDFECLAELKRSRQAILVIGLLCIGLGVVITLISSNRTVGGNSDRLARLLLYTDAQRVFPLKIYL